MIPPMKQSMLPFSSPTKGKAAPKEEYAIVIDDSDEEERFTTPPPPATMKDEVRKADGTVVELDQGSSRPHKVAKTNKNSSASGVDEKQGQAREKIIQKKKATSGDEVISSSNSSRLNKEVAVLAKKSTSESIMCHQHRQPCSTVLRCTFLKPDGSRCPNKFCYPTLQRVYKQDAGQIIKAGRNILGINAKEHVGPEVSSYLWKCPKCRGGCQCSACRKKLGLEPLGQIRSSKNVNALASTSKRVADQEADGTKKAKQTSMALEVSTNGGGIDGKSQSALGLNGQLSSKSQQVLHDITMQSEPCIPVVASSSAAGQLGLDRLVAQPLNTALGQLHAAAAKPKAPLQQQTFQKPLRKPKQVDIPQLTRMETRLPVPNIIERVWLYESLIRFDWFKVPKNVLMHLDKFDDWTESRVQIILERLICSIAEIGKIKATPTRKVHKRLVEAFRTTGEDLSRGEAWETGREYCLTRGLNMAKLVNVEPLPHQKGRESKATDNRWTKEYTLLGGRQTRSRRLAETQALERVKKITMIDMERSGESEPSDESTEETSLEDISDEEAPKGPRRSRRGLRKSARQRAKAVVRASVSDDDDAMSSAEESRSFEKERSESVVEVVEEERSLSPLPAPPFEQRVAILSSLVDDLLQSKQCNEEISFGFKQAVELEKAGKEEEKELLLKQGEELHEMDRKAPSMTLVEEFWQWKEDKEGMIKEHTFASLDLRVHTHLQLELHKSRCNSLGVDADGNEYWHLSEFVEAKPQDTAGRWAWSLLVLGSDYCKPKEVVERQLSTALQPIEVDSDRVSGNTTPVITNRGVEIKPINDGIVVLIDAPSRASFKKQDKHREEKEKTKTPEKQMMSTQPANSTAIMIDEQPANSTAIMIDEQPVKLFSGTNDPSTIGQLTEYIRYRLSLLEYEEQHSFRQKIQAEEVGIKEAAEGNLKLATETHTAVSLNEAATAKNMLHSSSERSSKHLEKAELRERQKNRRGQVEALLKKLEMIRDYYKWHEYDDV